MSRRSQKRWCVHGLREARRAPFEPGSSVRSRSGRAVGMDASAPRGPESRDRDLDLRPVPARRRGRSNVVRGVEPSGGEPGRRGRARNDGHQHLPSDRATAPGQVRDRQIRGHHGTHSRTPRAVGSPGGGPAFPAPCRAAVGRGRRAPGSSRLRTRPTPSTLPSRKRSPSIPAIERGRGPLPRIRAAIRTSPGDLRRETWPSNRSRRASDHPSRPADGAGRAPSRHLPRHDLRRRTTPGRRIRDSRGGPAEGSERGPGGPGSGLSIGRAQDTADPGRSPHRSTSGLLPGRAGSGRPSRIPGRRGAIGGGASGTRRAGRHAMGRGERSTAGADVRATVRAARPLFHALTRRNELASTADKGWSSPGPSRPSRRAAGDPSPKHRVRRLELLRLETRADRPGPLLTTEGASASRRDVPGAGRLQSDQGRPSSRRSDARLVREA